MEKINNTQPPNFLNQFSSIPVGRYIDYSLKHHIQKEENVLKPTAIKYYNWEMLAYITLVAEAAKTDSATLNTITAKDSDKIQLLMLLFKMAKMSGFLDRLKTPPDTSETTRQEKSPTATQPSH